ncbi:hypothetical protein [Gordonia alkanivorans]|uniref:hypothetical protein n=1 Tax=Gordonia alkanivorans TaxID=84096 RepID=UPI00244A04D6|nr:hypothetical protein [Gordonia alkanivorans]MDH3009372.1 hypothetical protein [Gordonia alkanivorans]MDH3014521.1 hypothetical protein [Gordonia alkanivorans]MDH3043613.1 hypothetical protein [Gordonia alkanivorans]
MTTPFSDDSLLPQPAPAMPVSPHGREYVVRAERAQWEQRAFVATSVRTELDEALRGLNRALTVNHFGDCTEGNDVFSAAQRALAKLSEQVTDHANTADELSRQCISAADQIEQADRGGATSFEI